MLPSPPPYSDHSSGRGFTIEGRPVEPGQLPSGMYQVTTPAYFDAVHLPLIAGRFLTEGDGADAPKVGSPMSAWHSAGGRTNRPSASTSASARRIPKHRGSPSSESSATSSTTLLRLPRAAPHSLRPNGASSVTLHGYWRAHRRRPAGRRPSRHRRRPRRRPRSSHRRHAHHGAPDASIAPSASTTWPSSWASSACSRSVSPPSASTASWSTWLPSRLTISAFAWRLARNVKASSPWSSAAA